MSTSTGKLKTKRVIQITILVALVIAAIFTIRYFSQTDVEVRAARVGFGDIVSSVSTNGKVEPLVAFQAHASEPGSVKSVLVRAGQQVAAGTLLIQMDSAAADARVASAQSAVAQAAVASYDLRQGGSTDERLALRGDTDRATLQVTQTEKDVAALQALQAKGAASVSELASAQSRLESARSSLASLQARTSGRYTSTDRQRVSAQLGDSQAGLRSAEDSRSKTMIRAPFAGTVYSLPVKAYDFVPAGDELVQMADLSRVQVRAYFDEPEIGKLHLNDAVVITWDAKAGKVWHGHISRVPTTVITYGTRNVGECIVTVDDAVGDLLPNTNVNAAVTTLRVFHVLSIPREALRTLGTENYVFVIQNGLLVKRAVQLGALNLQTAQITSGIADGDTVALNAISSSVDLQEGLHVKVVQR